MEVALQQMVSQMIAAETQDWSPAEKAALTALESLNLKDDELAAIASLSLNELDTRMKTDKKLTHLQATGI